MKRCLPGLMTILFLLSLTGCSDDAGTTDSTQSGADGSTLDALASLDGSQGSVDGSGRGIASDGYTGSKADGSAPEEDAGDESGDTDAPNAEDADSGNEDGDAESFEDTTLNDSTESDTENEDAEGADGSENDGELSDTDEGDAQSGDTDAGEDANDGGEDATDSEEEDSTEGAGDADVEEEDVYVPPVFSCTKDGDCVLQFPNLSPCEVATCFVETGDCGVVLLSDEADCSDGDPCSLGDRCLAGICTPTATECNDDNLCTNDVCFPGLGCVNEKNLDPCEDNDTCTLDDHCLGAKCIGVPLGCDDQDLCTNDFCIAGECQHQIVQDEDCCFVDVNQWKFSDGSFGGWLPLNAQEDVGWTVSDLNAASVAYSLYYGNEDTQSYETPGAANSGTITSQPVLLPTAGSVTFSFQLFLDIETGSSTDKFYVYLYDENGTKQNLWHKTSGTPQGVYYEHQLDVSAYAGQVIQFQFWFSTETSENNSGLGVFLDDIYIFSKCPEEPCVEEADCDDGFPCTTDSCVDLFCKHDVAEGCCTSDFQCDDDLLCTTDVCTDFECFNTNNESPCNDGDLCTVKDTCAEGTCLGEAKACDDDYSCSFDSCVEGVCVYDPSDEEGCCDIALVTWDMNSSELSPWEAFEPTLEDGEEAPLVGEWSIGNYVAASFPTSLEAGSGDEFGSDEGPTVYAMKSPTIDVPLSSSLELQFWLYLDVLPSEDMDILRFEGTSPTGKVKVLWEKPQNHPMQKWTYVKADASFFIDEGGVRLSMIFDTVTPGVRILEGVHIDDLRLYAPCGPQPCDPNYIPPAEEGGEAPAEEGGEAPAEEGGEAPAEEGGEAPAEEGGEAPAEEGGEAEPEVPTDCEDDDPSTVNTCTEEEICEEEPKLWFCETDADCDDLKLCTEAICFFNTCQFVLIPDCCENANECADGNVCTTDSCLGLEGCVLENNTIACDDSNGCTENDLCADALCGGTPVDCDDGTGCSTGTCAEDVCSYKYVDEPGCCGMDKAVFLGGEPTELEAWALDGNNTDSKWQISTAKYTSETWSLYYGNPQTQDYDAGSNAGTALSPSVWLPNAIETEAQFFLYVDIEEDPEFDTLHISVVVEGDVDNAITLWEKSQIISLQSFYPTTISLADYAGQNVQLLFAFDSVDGTANNREGVYVDDLRFHVVCPPVECVPGGDLSVCDDGDSCTTDSCGSEGFCLHDTQIGCCTTDSNCDDFNFCTEDSCTDSVCSFVVQEDCCFTAAECEDGDICTTDICDPVLGCIQENNADFCSDGDPCTKNDLCDEGVCSGVALECDDEDDLCTTDQCKEGVCVFSPTGADGCCETDADCEDNDDCTIDSCNEGSCLSINTCCQSDEECDDADDLCTNDQCVGGDCIYQPTGAPGCCEPLIYEENFISGDSAGFLLLGSNASSKWQVTSNGKSNSPTAALYYGNANSLNFNSGASNGTAVSPTLSLPDKTGLTLEFWAYMDTESSSSYDKLFLYLKNGGASSTIWQKNAYTPGGMKLWKKQVVNLDAYKGQNIQLEWYFNTVDSILNSGEGVYIDDVKVTQTCP